MKKLFLAVYHNENECTYDADVFVADDAKNNRDAFKAYFKNTYESEIEDKDILGIYSTSEVFDKDGNKYTSFVEPAS